jgi:hypothetical protein
MRSSGIKVPSCRAFSTFRSIKSSFPEAASAFICLSQSSSGKAGCSSAINSQYSSGESLAMASSLGKGVSFNHGWRGWLGKNRYPRNTRITRIKRICTKKNLGVFSRVSWATESSASSACSVVKRDTPTSKYRRTMHQTEAGGFLHRLREVLRCGIRSRRAFHVPLRNASQL